MEPDMTQRNALLALGIGAVASARFFYRKKMLRPFQASVILAWPTIGVAIMQTVIGNSTQSNVEKLSSAEGEAVEQQRAANAAFVERMRSLAAKSQQQQDQ